MQILKILYSYLVACTKGPSFLFWFGKEMFLVLENADFQIKAPHVLNGAGRVQIYVQQCIFLEYAVATEFLSIPFPLGG